MDIPDQKEELIRMLPDIIDTLKSVTKTVSEHGSMFQLVKIYEVLNELKLIEENQAKLDRL